MDLRELKTQFLNANIVTDNIKVIFRLPNCKSYYNCHCHIVNINGNNVLMIDLIDKIKPKFKVGDKLINVNCLFLDRSYTISEVNEEKQYYTYKEVKGRTYFKDQDKVILVNDEVRPPVEDDIKLDEFNVHSVKNNVLSYNLKHYPLIRNMINLIIKSSNEGKNCHTFIVPYVAKNDTFGVYYDEDEICGIIRWHFKELGFNVKDKNDEINNRTEFFISW